MLYTEGYSVFATSPFMNVLPPDFPIIGIVLILGLVFAMFFALFRALLTIRQMKTLLKNLQDNGFTRIDTGASQRPWYIQTSWPLPVFFRFELQKERAGNDTHSSKTPSGALYIPITTPRTSSDVLRTLLTFESPLLRAEAFLTTFFLGWLRHIFPNPKHLLDSTGGITLYTPDILPVALQKQLPTVPTMVIRYSVASRSTCKRLHEKVTIIHKNI